MKRTVEESTNYCLKSCKTLNTPMNLSWMSNWILPSLKRSCKNSLTKTKPQKSYSLKITVMVKNSLILSYCCSGSILNFEREM